MNKTYLRINNSLSVERYKEYSRVALTIVITQEHVQAWIESLESLSRGTAYKVTLHDNESNIYIAFLKKTETNAKGITIDYNSQNERYILYFSKDQLECCIAYYKQCYEGIIMEKCHLDMESDNTMYDLCFAYKK